ncbi:DUF2252 domain-containing protein [Microbacterium sp. QXD-8]|uniref:DUF2252 domain-containing protein n=1 Tax=Microbacterium psychrotolerans TaxID=3068321 RepID=A0ABU0YXX8_9MICO|nr:DUF2252 domain-containing protein [Microbacterium sp. QXD-8]MDQ7877187.1 DUF2252 domain-containing protein [Microbacterium sp. QXD-8]
MSTTAESPIGRTWAPLPSHADHVAEGRAARQQNPREALAELPTNDRDPMGILDAQDADRVPELVPLRTERMAASAFAFYRGTAALMAADLARSPSSGVSVGSCGDAHVSNFGLYASPQRTLVFDLNDFDESAWAPWEWDVKRLVASIVIAGQSTGRADSVIREASLDAVRVYARSIGAGAKRSPLKRYYDRFDALAAERAVDDETRAAIDSAIKEAEKRTGARAAKKMTQLDAEGRIVFVESPPTMTHIDAESEERALRVFDQYVKSANIDIRALLQKYRLSDIALRVVGVGSVGTRCLVIAMQDGDDGVLLLQGKEAGRSVLIEHGKAEQPEAVSRFIDQYGEGGRVVGMQRILQAVSDPFLGFVGHTTYGAQRDFYVRQFRDKKGGFDMDALDDKGFLWYADACAATLARAHGQSPASAAVAGYLGGGRVAGEAILEWAYAYADLSLADWKLFRTHRGVEAAA